MMATHPNAIPHRIHVSKAVGSKPWCAACDCGRWEWHSNYHRIALLMGTGHLINQARKVR